MYVSVAQFLFCNQLNVNVLLPKNIYFYISDKLCICDMKNRLSVEAVYFRKY